MLEAIAGITVAVLIATGSFWLLVLDDRKQGKAARQDRKRKNPVKYYFLPWLLSVIGLSLVGFQILVEAIDMDDALYAVMLIVILVWGLLYAKSQMADKR